MERAKAQLTLWRAQSARTLRTDKVVRGGFRLLALLVLALVAYFFFKLVQAAWPIMVMPGLGHFISVNDWDVGRDIYGAWPLVAGTLITSGIALVIGVPVAVASALYITELASARVRDVLALLVDLLAAVPSVIYGLWGVFVLIPTLKPIEQWLATSFGVQGVVSGPNYFIAGLILAIMIIPIVLSISREVLMTVPAHEKEAALALGATKWEMIRLAVLPHSRMGIMSASMLGLGRAIGETIAVTLVIGNAAVLGSHLFDQGYTLAAVIANEFGEAAAGSLHSAALFAAGLVLFVMTLIINSIARGLVFNAYRDRKAVKEWAVE